MVIASAQRAFVIDPPWLHTMGQIAGTLLLVELLLALAIVCALMGGLAYAAWWLHRNVIPVVDQYGQQAQQVMGVAGRSGERIVERVATFHGAQVGIFTGLRVFLFGRPQPQREVVPLTAEPAQTFDRPDQGPAATADA
jgi:hypothetical protein